MRVNRTIVSAACAMLAFAAVGSWAQEAPSKPELLVVYQDHVKPAKLDDYTAVAKDMVALLKEEKADSPAFDLWAFSSPDFTFTYVTPMSSMGEMDTMHEAWMALYKGPDKAKWEAFDARVNGAVLTSSRQIVARVASASYKPKEPRLSQEEAKYRWFDVFTVQPGKEKDFVGLCKSLAELAAKAGFKDGWNTYSVVVGPAIPCFIVVSPAKDQGDYAESDRAFSKAVGDEGKKIFAQVMAITEHYDGHGEWFRPEFSYQTPSRLKAMEAEKGEKDDKGEKVEAK